MRPLPALALLAALAAAAPLTAAPPHRSIPMPGAVWSMAFSPSGTRLVVVGEDGFVRILQAPRWAVLHEFQAWPATLRVVAFSRDGRRMLIAGDPDRTTTAAGITGLRLRVIDPGTLATLAEYRGGGGALWGAAFEPDGESVLALDDQGKIHRYSLQRARSVIERPTSSKLQPPTGWLTGPRTSPPPDPGSSTLGPPTGSFAEPVVLASLGTWSHSDLVVTPDGGTALVGTGGNSPPAVFAVNLTKPGSSAILVGHKSALRSLALSPDGRILATGSWDFSLRLTDLADHVSREVARFEEDVNALAFDRAGRWLAAGIDDGTLALRSPSAPTRDLRWQGHPGHVSAVALSPDGSLLASGGEEHAVRIWDLSRVRPPAP